VTYRRARAANTKSMQITTTEYSATVVITTAVVVELTESWTGDPTPTEG
jgi:hypothetical protein